MLVRDIMTTDPTTLREDEALLDATLIFARASFRHIPILNGKQLVGIVTERDLKHYTPSILSGIPPEEYNRLMETTPLSKIMTRDPAHHRAQQNRLRSRPNALRPPHRVPAGGRRRRIKRHYYHHGHAEFAPPIAERKRSRPTGACNLRRPGAQVSLGSATPW